MMNLRNFIGLFLISLLFFTACKKDAITPENTTTSPNPPPTTTVTPTTDTPLNTATTIRAMAAAASVAHSRNNESDTTETDCGCYDLFDEVDFDASHEAIEAAIEAIFEALPDTEIARLFEPVCTDDGEIFESACIADCEGITNYHTCSEEELEDYFFGDFECDDLDNLTFPTEIELPDGTTVTVNSEEELFDLLDKWFEENGDDFEEEWEGEWDEEWDDEDYFEDCFTLIFPISIQYPDGETIIYDSEEAIWVGIEAWYDVNPESEDDPMPVYPFDVLLADSTVITINSEMDEDAIWETCFGDIDFDLCFDINFPVTLIYPDGSTIAVNSYDEAENTVDEFYEANPDSEADILIQYPITITLADGTVQTIADEEALDAALEACFDEDDFGKIAQQGRKSALSAKRVVKGAVLSGSLNQKLL